MSFSAMVPVPEAAGTGINDALCWIYYMQLSNAETG